MVTAILFPQAPDIEANDYCVLGLATCFLKTEGEFQQVEVIEPIPSAALEAILKGIPTSYKFARAIAVGDIFVGETPQIPTGFPASAQWCADLSERLVAAVRTYKNRPEAKTHIPLGTKREDLHYSLEKKRVLNAINVVRSEDNVKQHPHTHQVL